MPVAELGYRHWEGKRTGVTRRWLAIARSEIAIAYQSSRLLRRFLYVAWVPILYFCPVFLAVGYVADPANELGEGAMLTEIAREFLSREGFEKLRADPQLVLPGIWSITFYWFFAWAQSILAMIAVAIIGPPLIAKDIRSKAFLVYFSKPIQPWQYLVGKLATVAFFVFSMTLFPALFLYAVSIALSPDATTMTATLPIVFDIAVAAFVVAIPTAMVVLLLSSLTKDRRVATFAWVAICLFGEISFRILTVGFPGEFEPPAWASLLSIHELTTKATAGVFDLQGNTQTLMTDLASDSLNWELQAMDTDLGLGLVAETGLSPTASIVALVVLSGVCAVVIMRRTTKSVRI